MRSLNNFMRKYWENNVFLVIMSAVIAVVLWLFISLTQYPSIQKTVYHVPVSYDISGSVANQNGLSITERDVEEVTVELLASRTEVGYLNSDNLVAYLDADSVSNVGTKKLTIKIRSENDTKVNYEIKSVTPSSATVVFDKIDTREFPITPLTPKVKVADGKQIDAEEFVCDPSVVRITGPSAQLDKISQCCAVSNKEMTLDSSYVLTSEDIQLYNDSKVLIDPSLFKFSDMNFNIIIPVRTQKNVKLSVSIVNAPDNFNKDAIKFKMSAESVTLACENSQTEIPDTLDIGVIPLNDLKPDFSRTFYIGTSLENSEYINVSDIEAVNVSIDSSNLKETALTLDKNRITISNIPDSSYTYNIKTQRMDIIVIGSEESISQITAEDIIADVNLLNLNITSNQFNQNVTFSCPTYDDVWVITQSKVSVQREKTKSPTASQ